MSNDVKVTQADVDAVKAILAATSFSKDGAPVTTTACEVAARHRTFASTASTDEIARLRAENEALREAVRIALACTPSARNGEVIYDCGNPWEILSIALKGSRHD